MKRLISFIIALVLLFSVYYVSVHIPKDYSYRYILDDFVITEKYYKTKKYYVFDIKYNNEEYEYSLKEKYTHTRGLIKKVTIKDSCLYVKTTLFNSFTICKNNNEYITKFYNNEFDNSIINNYENINIYNELNNTFLIWNYKDFLYINGKNNKHIKVFDSDAYELKIITKLDRHLVVADYNQKYYFEKLFIIDSKSGHVKESKLNRKVYFDSYILGTYKNNIYLYDDNKEIEYIINPFKNTIEKNKYEFLNNGKWEKTSVNKLKKQEVKFNNNEDYHYQLIDNYLYYITPINRILVTNLKVARIIESDDKTAFFISEEALYYVDIDQELIKVMSYSEWLFNNQNIYIF